MKVYHTKQSVRYAALIVLQKHTQQTKACVINAGCLNMAKAKKIKIKDLENNPFSIAIATAQEILLDSLSKKKCNKCNGTGILITECEDVFEDCDECNGVGYK
jgi:ribonuclease PH